MSDFDPVVYLVVEAVRAGGLDGYRGAGAAQPRGQEAVGVFPVVPAGILAGDVIQCWLGRVHGVSPGYANG